MYVSQLLIHVKSKIDPVGKHLRLMKLKWNLQKMKNEHSYLLLRQKIITL